MLTARLEGSRGTSFEGSRSSRGEPPFKDTGRAVILSEGGGGGCE